MRAIGLVKNIVCALALALLSVHAHAQFGHQLFVHPKAAALGNAVTADPPGIMAIRRNPAGLTRLEGRQWEVGLSLVRLNFGASFNVPDEGCDVFGIECAENDPVANTEGSTGRIAVYAPGIGQLALPDLPVDSAPLNAAFSVQAPGSKLTFANGAWMEFVGGFSKEDDDPGRYMAPQAALQRVTYLAPTMAYKINDNWSVGAGINFSHHGVAVKQLARAPNMLVGVGATLQDAFGCDEEKNEPLAPWLALCGGKIGPFQDIGSIDVQMEESLSPSFRTGVLWEPTDWFTWGAQYSSGDDMTLKGEFNLNYTEDWQGFWQSVNSSVLGAIGAAILSLPSGVPKERAHVTVNESHPQHFSTGISARVLPWMTVNVDADYVDLSSQRFVNMKFDRELEFTNAARILAPENATSNSMRLDRDYTDIWNLGYGVTFHASSRLDLRAGIQHRGSVIPKGSESLLSPIGEGNLIGIGLGYKWNKNARIDMSASHFSSSQHVPADSSDNLNSTSITNIVYNPYAGLDVDIDTTATFLGLTIRSKF